MKYGIEPEALYSATQEAPAAIKSSNCAMKRGRRSGTLSGVSSPPFIKLGSAFNAKIVYRGQALIDYLDQFEEQQTTMPDQLQGKEYAQRN